MRADGGDLGVFQLERLHDGTPRMFTAGIRQDKWRSHTRGDGVEVEQRATVLLQMRQGVSDAVKRSEVDRLERLPKDSAGRFWTEQGDLRGYWCQRHQVNDLALACQPPDRLSDHRDAGGFIARVGGNHVSCPTQRLDLQRDIVQAIFPPRRKHDAGAMLCIVPGHLRAHAARAADDQDASTVLHRNIVWEKVGLKEIAVRREGSCAGRRLCSAQRQGQRRSPHDKLTA